MNLEWDKGTGDWISLIGGTYNSLLTTFTVTGLTPGHNYNFRYRAKNDFGWGPYSNIATIKAATSPDQMDVPMTSTVGSDVRIEWTEPDIRGDPITSYTIYIADSTGTFIAQSIGSSCDGTDPTIISQKWCKVTLLDLQATPFDLQQGDLV